MRTVDMYRAMFTSLYTLYDETPEPDKDEKIWEFIEKYMPNYGRNLPPKDTSLMQQFEKYVNKRHKESNIEEDAAFEIVKSFVKERTEFNEFFSTLPLEDWKSLCDLIDASNTVTAVNAMKDAGVYESMVRSGQGDKIMEYIQDHPDLMDKADPQLAMQAMGAMGGMGMSSPAAQPVKKTIHPNMKKKNKNKKKKKK